MASVLDFWGVYRSDCVLSRLQPCSICQKKQWGEVERRRRENRGDDVGEMWGGGIPFDHCAADNYGTRRMCLVLLRPRPWAYL